ncbi:AbrB/MazE/SpoVT family DNA-binding domain-containing protein [candidate division KSB1 bacterium]|nr:AbrB/MazE/SpoVT family DNA-binding domain-containing protein [candidate division KSB1 bacterium]
MKIKIQKWGNSLAIRIPKSFAKQIKIDQGSILDLTTEKGKIVAQPVDDEEYSLDQLLKGVTKENLHDEIDFGNAVGKEIW